MIPEPVPAHVMENARRLFPLRPVNARKSDADTIQALIGENHALRTENARLEAERDAARLTFAARTGRKGNITEYLR